MAAKKRKKPAKKRGVTKAAKKRVAKKSAKKLAKKRAVKKRAAKVVKKSPKRRTALARPVFFAPKPKKPKRAVKKVSKKKAAKKVARKRAATWSPYFAKKKKAVRRKKVVKRAAKKLVKRVVKAVVQPAPKKVAKKKVSKSRVKRLDKAQIRRVFPRELTYLHKRMGSYAAIARAVGVTGGTITRWARDGLPPGSPNLDMLAELWKSESQQVAMSAKETQDFELLRQLAGGEGEVPSVRTWDGTFKGDLAAGYEWDKHFARELDQRLLEEIERWATNVRTNLRFPWWQMVAVVSEYALQGVDFTRSGSGMIVQYEHTDLQQPIGEFIPKTAIPTFKSDLRTMVISDMTARLQAAVNAGQLRVFVHGVVLKNYRITTQSGSEARAARKVHQVARRKSRESKSTKKQTRTKKGGRTRAVARRK